MSNAALVLLEALSEMVIKSDLNAVERPSNQVKGGLGRQKYFKCYFMDSMLWILSELNKDIHCTGKLV